MVIIEAKDLKYVYASDEDSYQIALAGVTLNIEKGEYVAVIGHNGSGKSTFAKHLNVLLAPQEGELRVLGIDTREEDRTWDIRSKVGMVFQNPDNQMVSTIVEEDIAFGPENLGVPREEILARVNKALAAVDMEGFNLRAPHMLSGGQKQRIAIAGVLAMEPEIIVFDEPTSMLDPQGRQEVLEVIRRLNQQENKTIVLITHYMEEAVECDRIFVMDEGKITAEGKPEEVFAQTDVIQKAGLMPPPAAQIANALRARGIELDRQPGTIEELVDEICLLKQKI